MLRYRYSVLVAVIASRDLTDRKSLSKGEKTMRRNPESLPLGPLVPPILMIAAVLTMARVSGAQMPLGTAFTYSGQLKQGGSPVNDTCDYEFELYDDPDGANQVGPTVPETVVVAGGQFTVGLDFGSDIFTGDARWLEIAVCCPSPCDNFTTLSPRQELTPTPYALFAASGNPGPAGPVGPPGPEGSAGLGGLREFIEVGEHTWVAPEGVKRVMVEFWGGSGGGGGAGNSVESGDPPECSSGWWGGGGGGAGYLRAVVDVVPGETYIVRVGAGGGGGAGGDSSNSIGEAGADGTPTRFEMDIAGTILASAGGGGGGGGGGAAAGSYGAAGAGGSVAPLEGLARPGQDGGLCIQIEDIAECISFFPGATATGTVSRLSSGDPFVIIGLFPVIPGLGGLPSGILGFSGGICGSGGAGSPGNDGYAVLQW